MASTWIVQVVDADDDTAGSVYGPFARRDTAEAFAERVQSRVRRDDVSVFACPLRAPLLRHVREEGFFQTDEETGRGY